MFKIVANIGEWQSLYVSKFASKRLHSFLPANVSYDEGKLDLKLVDEFLIERLLIQGGGSRPRMVLLISENEIGLEVASRIKADLGDCLYAMIEGSKLSDSVSEQMTLSDYCRQFEAVFEEKEKRLKIHQTQMRAANSTARSARWLSLASILGATVLAFLVPYFFFSKPQAIESTAILAEATKEMEKRLEDLESRLSRSSVRVNKLSGLISKESLNDLELRLEAIERKWESPPQNQDSTGEILAKTIEISCVDEGGAFQNSIVVKQFKQSKTIELGFKSSVLTSWIEVMGGLEKKDFKVLETSTSDSGQVELLYQRSADSKRAIRGKIRVHVLFRENTN